jgi:hypothetical protein
MVVDGDETRKLGSTMDNCVALVVKFLTEVCHHVGNFWYQIVGQGKVL